jgi:hypothetical protein
MSSPVIVRPISIRCISLVPSKIVKILAVGTVFAVQRPADYRGISTDSARPGSRVSYTGRHSGPGAVVAWPVRWLNLVAGSGQIRCLLSSPAVCCC